MSKTKALVLFNENLRLHDNLALHKAAEDQCLVTPIYIYDPYSSRAIGSSHKWWLHNSLKTLNSQLEKKHSQLVLRKGNFLKSIQELVQESQSKSLYWHRSPDPAQQDLYESVKIWAKKNQIQTYEATANLLVNPEEISPLQGGYFQVYTPFWKTCLKVLSPNNPVDEPDWIPAPKISTDDLESWKLCNNLVCTSLDSYWSAGEESAKKRLHQFLQNDIVDYCELRDRLDLDKTSMLSPHLRWGEISIRYIWKELEKNHEKSIQKGVGKFIGELGFREFSYYILHHFPQIGSQNFRKKFDKFAWSQDETKFNAWKEGKTGYPVVDAAMQQLIQSGWVHNRARLIAGSFLTKDLLIHWKLAEQWYWECLVDGDIALKNTINN